MLTPAQIAAETTSPALTDEQVLNLSLLVKQYSVYVRNLGLFPDLAAKLEAEQTTPTVKTQALKAVLTALGDLPELVVESQGSDTRPSHFTTKENWDSLALDVLNTLYVIPAGLLNHQSFAVTVPSVEKFLINDDLLSVKHDSLLKT